MDDGGLSVDEDVEFKAWISAQPEHAAAFAEAEFLWSALGSIEYEESLQISAVDRSFFQSFIATASRLFELPSPIFAGGLVAASLVAILCLVPGFLPGQTIDPTISPPEFAAFQTGKGELKTVALDDGTVLTLGALSTVEVSLSKTERSANLLSGAAFFDVAKDPDAPFSVRAGAASVRVTGTAFDLQRRGDTLSVSVAEGEVVVSHPLIIDGVVSLTDEGEWSRKSGQLLETVSLAAGEMVFASRSDGLGQKSDVQQTNIGAWRQGQLVYFKSSLADIVSDVNRY